MKLEKVTILLLFCILTISIISLYFSLKLRNEILSEFSIGVKTKEEDCRKICSVFHNSTEYLVDGFGNCWCLAEGSIITKNKIIKIKTWRNYGVILNVEETHVIYTNSTS